MDVVPTRLEGVLVIVPDVFTDRRGFFMETYRKERYRKNGVGCDFVQDNLSFSRQNTLRGLHYQYPHEQAKLVSVVRGEVFDVAVDIRRGSPTFGQWEGVRLSAENHRQLFVPAGFAHGFCVISDDAIFSYKCSDYYAPQAERGIRWNDPRLDIQWPVKNPQLSEKDGSFACLGDVTGDALPRYIVNRAAGQSNE